LVEARSSEPLLPLGLFKSTVFSTANFSALVVGFALLGTVFFVAQFFQGVQGYTALQSGTRTLPTTIGIFIMAPLAGRITARFGPRLPIAAGAALAGVALLLLTRLEPMIEYGAIWWNFALFGIGIGLSLSPITAAVLAAVPPNRAGLASSMVSTSRQIGSVLGVAVLGAVVQNQEARDLVSGLGNLHVPAPLSTTLANSIATAGAQAGQLPFPLRFHISGAGLVHLVWQSFTSALHPAFVISGLALLLVAVLAFTLLGRGGHITTQGTPVEASAIDSLDSLEAPLPTETPVNF
jgi:DHA2 family methylenomycin A resistance protein-like MFS transporter